MKNIYELRVIRNNSFNREEAVRIAKKLQIARRSMAEYVKAVKKNGFRLNMGDQTYMVEELKACLGRELDKNKHSVQITRFFNRYQKRTEYIPFYRETNEDLKGIVGDIRAVVRHQRAARKRNEDFLASKRPNEILLNYQSRILSSRKQPKDDSQYVGIEIECVMPSGTVFTELLPYGKYIDVGNDGSIQYGSNEDGKEIRVCMRREEIRTVLPKIVSVLVGLGAYVNKSCGLHVHLDQRNNPTPELSFKKLVRSLGLLYTVVPRSRRNNTYCKKNTRSNFDSARRGERYKAVNATAYYRYKTLEIRLFGGTLNADKMINWIETLIAISDGAIVNRCPKNFDTARKYWTALSDENIAWLKARQTQFAELNALAPQNESDTNDTNESSDDNLDDIGDDEAEIMDNEEERETVNV